MKRRQESENWLACFFCGCLGGNENFAEIRAGSLSRLATSPLDFTLAGQFSEGTHNQVKSLWLYTHGIFSVSIAPVTSKPFVSNNQVMNCQETVLSRNPCEKVTCPNGHKGRHEMLFYECPGIPELCPLSVKNNSATCCPEKCAKEHKQNKRTNKETCTRMNQSTDRPT